MNESFKIPSSNMKSRASWQEFNDLQRKLFLKYQKKVKLLEPPKSLDFLVYEKNYLKSVKNYQKISSYQEIIDHSLQSDLILIGDYHTLNQSQKSLVRFLRELIESTSKIYLCMELIYVSHQKYLDQFLKGRINSIQLKKRISFHQNWFFDFWDHYLPIFEFCRNNSIPIFGIESDQKDKLGLNGRDEFCADQIVKLNKKYPQYKGVVFIGDLHLAPDHLPKRISNLSPHLKSLILYQNSESIYWKLAKENLISKTHVVKISHNQFCRMHTLPVIALQSYLNWLEKEDDLSDYDKIEEVFHDYLKTLAKFFGFKLGEKIDQVEVFSMEDLSFLKRLKKDKEFSKLRIELIKKQILNSKSYYISKYHFIYLADVSINHIAEQAIKVMRKLLVDQDENFSMKSSFYYQALISALSFFGSKIINGRRKTKRPFQAGRECFLVKNSKDLSELEKEDFLVNQYFVQHQSLLKSERVFTDKKISKLTIDEFRKLVRLEGNYFGERLFYGYLDGLISKKEIKDFFFNPIEEEEIVDNYLYFYHVLRPLKLPRRV